jgi:hypothetical protein
METSYFFLLIVEGKLDESEVRVKTHFQISTAAI